MSEYYHTSFGFLKGVYSPWLLQKIVRFVETNHICVFMVDILSKCSFEWKSPTKSFRYYSRFFTIGSRWECWKCCS